jgi:RecG-like helicase
MGTGLKDRLRRMTAPQSERDAADIAEQCSDRTTTAVTACRVGQQVSVAGTVRCVRLAPLAGAPTFEVDLWDGSGTVRLVFLGRRTIPGLTAGRTVVADGRLTRRDGRMTVFNPRYELMAPTRA